LWYEAEVVCVCQCINCDHVIPCGGGWRYKVSNDLTEIGTT